MFAFFAPRLGLQKFIASFVLVGFVILEAGITLAPIAKAEADPIVPEPELVISLVIWEGTSVPEFVPVTVTDGENTYTMMVRNTNSSVVLSRPDADVSLKWEFNTRGEPYSSNCKLYGMAARTLPTASGSLVLHSPMPGIYAMTCAAPDGHELARTKVEVTVPGASRLPFACNLGPYTNALFGQDYWPGSITGPGASGNEARLVDTSSACKVLGIPDDIAWGTVPVIFNWDGVPDYVDDQIGWPASRVDVYRTTAARYKDPQTVSVCTRLATTATKYRLGFSSHGESFNPGEGETVYWTVIDPFEISHEAPVTETREDCIDRPLDDTIITTNISQCGTDESYSFFSTEYTYRCDTNAAAANGKVAACRYETVSSVFGGIFSWILPMLLVAAGPFLSWLSALVSAFLPTTLANMVAILFSYTGSLTDFLLTLASLYQQGVSMGMAGSVSAPDPGLGECSWSPGFTPQTVGEPLCTSGCAFNPKTVIEGQKTNYPWNFSSGVSRFDFSCAGDLGRWSGNVPADAPYSGNAEFYPKQTQACTLTLTNSVGASKTYADTITVTPLAGAPTCSLSFSPNQIRAGDTAIARWKLSTDTAKIDHICSGDIGSRTGVSVPRDFPYEGEAAVSPGASQSCTATVYDISGQRGSCSASITVTPPPENGDCAQNYTGKNDQVGLSNGDTRFLCKGSRWYDCGWENNDPSWETKATNMQRVGSWFCGLAQSQWTQGTIVWKIMLDGAPRDGSVVVDYSAPNGSGVNLTVPTGSYFPAPAGSYAYTYISGGPAGATFQNINGVGPTVTQVLSTGGTMTYTFHFTNRQFESGTASPPPTPPPTPSSPPTPTPIPTPTPTPSPSPTPTSTPTPTPTPTPAPPPGDQTPHITLTASPRCNYVTGAARNVVKWTSACPSGSCASGPGRLYACRDAGCAPDALLMDNFSLTKSRSFSHKQLLFGETYRYQIRTGPPAANSNIATGIAPAGCTLASAVSGTGGGLDLATLLSGLWELLGGLVPSVP